MDRIKKAVKKLTRLNDDLEPDRLETLVADLLENLTKKEALINLSSLHITTPIESSNHDDVTIPPNMLVESFNCR